MEAGAIAMQTYQARCRMHCIEPAAEFLDAVARGAEAFTCDSTSSSSAHLEALAAALPDTSIVELTLCQVKLSCSSWAVLSKACCRVAKLSLQACDLSALDGQRLARDCAQLRLSTLGAHSMRPCC